MTFGARLQGWLLARHGVVLLSVALSLLGWSAVRTLSGDALQRLEARSGDWVWRLSAERRDERRLIIVDIDEKSLHEVGPWPWSRPTVARLVEQLAAAGVRQQVLDIVFPDGKDGDAALSLAMQRHQVVLAQIFALHRDDRTAAGQPAGALDWSACPLPFPQASGHLANAASLGQARVGHITPRVAVDGIVREQPAVICYRQQAYPALGLAALMQGTAETGLSLERGTGWLDPAWRLVGKGRLLAPIPLDEQGDLRIPWGIHPDAFISLSASDVLAGRVPSGLLGDAWVLVGSSAFGLHDAIATPFDGASSGMQAHAQLITALIDGRVPATPRSAPVLLVALAVAGVALLILLARSRERFPIHLLPVAALLWGVGLYALHGVLQARAALWLGWADPALFVALAGLSMGVLEHARSRLDRNRLYAHLASYLPAPVAEALALQPPSSAIKASTRQVSVMFADIRNFSAYCEARPPEEAAAVLHAFFSVATRVVEQHGGVVESFQGDAVVAVWGADPATPGAPGASAAGGDSRLDGASALPAGASHAGQALQAAIELQSAMHGVLPDPAPEGLEPLALGIGVETGPAMEGSFGLASRRTHMVMGRTVTIASRLVGMTADLSHPILVGEGLAAQVGGLGLQSMGTFLLDGLRVPHHVYAPPLSPDPAPAREEEAPRA